MKVKFLTAVQHDGETYAEGDSADIAAPAAKQLIASGAAESPESAKERAKARAESEAAAKAAADADAQAIAEAAPSGEGEASGATSEG